MSRPTLRRAIPRRGVTVADTSVALAYLNGSEPYSGAAAMVIDEIVSDDAPVILSAISVTELLVRPMQAGGAALATAETFLRSFPNLRLRDVDYAVAREAARVRARTGLKAPDALVVATAIVEGAQTLVSVDDRWRTAIERLGGLTLVHLGDHVPL